MKRSNGTVRSYYHRPFGICHRKIHYGLKDEKSSMLDKIYYDRADRLAESGLKISKEDFENIVGMAN